MDPKSQCHIVQFETSYHCTIRHNLAHYGMLSFELTPDLVAPLKALNQTITTRFNWISSLSDEEKSALHRFARVSTIGASTRIENAVLTDAEVHWMDTVISQDARPTAFQTAQAAIENKLSKDRERSIEEVAGCRHMLMLIYGEHTTLFPLTGHALRGLHQTLMAFYPPARPYAGQYKTVSNSVIERNWTLHTERMVLETADPGPITETAMRDLLDWYNDTLPKEPWSIAVAAEFVFRFLAIHPFQDGNGRMGRALFLLVLLQSPDAPLAELAPYLAIDREIEKHRHDYYAVLERCSGGRFSQDPRTYAIAYFLRFMCLMVEKACTNLSVCHDRFVAIQKLSETARAVLACFHDYPETRLQTKTLIAHLKLPRRTLIHALTALLKHGLIQKQGQGAGTRYQLVF